MRWGPGRGAVWVLPALVFMTAACGSSRSPSQPSSPSPRPPGLSLVCPPAVNTFAPEGDSLTVEFPAPQASGGTSPVQVTCNPASASRFPVGDTTVTCSGRDAANQEGVCTFVVHVDPPPPRISITDYLAFGDSLTEGRVFTLSSGQAGSPDSYPYVLESLLGARYKAQTIVVINAGLGGERATEGRRRLRNLLDQVDAPAVLIMQGSNDLALLELTGTRTRGFGELRHAIDGMVRDAQARSRRVFLATLPPQREGGDRAEAWELVAPFNREIQSVASTRKVPLVDVYSAIAADMSLIGPDGLHLTPAGYARVAAAFAEVLQRTLETPPT